MAKSVDICAWITVDPDERLSRLAAATGHFRSSPITEAVRSQVVSEAGFAETVGEGLSDLVAGEAMDHDSAFTALEQRKRRCA